MTHLSGFVIRVGIEKRNIFRTPPINVRGQFSSEYFGVCYSLSYSCPDRFSDEARQFIGRFVHLGFVEKI